MDERKKAQLKKNLKPIIQEVIEEVLAEGTLVRSIITEAVKAAASQNQQVIVERHYGGGFVQPHAFPQQYQQQPQQQPQISYNTQESVSQHSEEEVREMERRKAEIIAAKQKEGEQRRARLAEVAGLNQKLFETTKPLSDGGHADKQTSNKSNAHAGPLRNIDPADPGVNINGIMDLIGGANVWKNQIK